MTHEHSSVFENLFKKSCVVGRIRHVDSASEYDDGFFLVFHADFVCQTIASACSSRYNRKIFTQFRNEKISDFFGVGRDFSGTNHAKKWSLIRNISTNIEQIRRRGNIFEK